MLSHKAVAAGKADLLGDVTGLSNAGNGDDYRVVHLCMTCNLPEPLIATFNLHIAYSRPGLSQFFHLQHSQFSPHDTINDATYTIQSHRTTSNK